MVRQNLVPHSISKIFNAVTGCDAAENLNEVAFAVTVLKCMVLGLGKQLCFVRRGVAQFGSARRSGRRSRRFKSCHPDPVLMYELPDGSSGCRQVAYTLF